MIRRQVNIPKSKSFFLFGARGTGKSTWLQAAFPEDLHLWADLTNPDVERRYARRPSLLLDEWKARAERTGDKPWIVVDEVQKIPAILDVAHVGIQRHKIRFALTGSSARKLKRAAANLLAGRAQTYHLHPFTWLELGRDFDLESYLTWGGLPEIYDTPDAADRRRYLDSYQRTYLREEIQVEQLVRKIEPFRMFLDVVGQVSGEVINIARIAREAGIDPKSGERYFEILNDTLLGFYLPAFNRSIRKRQLQHPKFYLFDVGVRRAIRRELSVAVEPQTTAYGHAFEHFIVSQLVALNDYCESGYGLSYLRTKDDVEVDVVVERAAKKPIFIEIKSSERVAPEDLGGYMALTREAGAEGMVLCRTPREYALSREIRAVPWQQGLLEIFGIGDDKTP